MARKRKSKGNVEVASSSPSGPRRINISLEEAENGFTINCSHSGKNGEYTSKSYVAPNERSAMRIAGQGLSQITSKSKGKKKGKKKISGAKGTY